MCYNRVIMGQRLNLACAVMAWTFAAAVGAAVWADDAAEARLAPEPPRDLAREHKVRLVYFVATDREPVEQWRSRIITLMTFVNDAVRRDLIEKGWETEGFDFEFDEGGVPIVHLVRGEHPAAHYNGRPDYHHLTQWRTVNPEVEAQVGPPRNRLHVIFVETYDDEPARVEWPGGNAQAAFLSADAGAAMKSAWILRPEFCATSVADQLDLLFDDTPIEGRNAIGHGGRDSPRHHFIEDGFGAVIHELGHALSLYHDHRHRLYHMGNGFRHLRTRFRDDLPHEQRSRFSEDAARLLARSRFLAPPADGEDADETAPVMTVSVLGRPHAGDEHVRLRIEATDDRALAAAVFYTAANDSVAIGLPLEGTRVQIDELKVPHPPLRAGEEITLRARIVDKAGNFAHLTLNLTVAEEES